MTGVLHGGCSLAVMLKPILYKAVFCKPVFYNLPRAVPVVFAGPSPPVRAEEVDRTLQRQDSGVESALLYAKAWSKYTKELLAWVEKRLNMGELGISTQVCLTFKEEAAK